MSSKIILAAALVGGASARLFTDSRESQKYMWESFKTEYGKTYDTMEEEAHRFGVFVNNLKVIDARQAKETSATHGLTKFADQTVAEFKASHLNYVRPADFNATHIDIPSLPEGTDALVDWTGKYTTPVKDQGYCGSCWAFSVTEQTESDYMREHGQEQILSAQQVTSCTNYLIAGGCNGGNTEKGFDYANAGLETDANYPYTSGQAGVTGSCSSDSSKFVVKTTGYTNVANSASGESKMATYVQSTGPLSIIVDAEEWSSYTGGVLSTCGDNLDHAVQAVGIDTAAGYWKVRNSWGTSWGEAGFIRLAYGKNLCGLASDANYAATAAY
jgi:C1A family cysteine protease